MTTCMIIDDEPNNVAILEKMLMQFCTGISIVGSASDGDTAIHLIRQLQPQLIFLDIEMPGLNAFDLLNKITPLEAEIIFVTAYDNYAVTAFKYSAIGYLLKPVDIDELRLAVARAEECIGTASINQRLRDLAEQIQDRSAFARITLRTNDGMLFYEPDQIVSCSAEGAYTRFGFTNGEELLVSGTLKVYEGALSTGHFFRIHDSHLINLHHMRKYYYGKGGYVEMSNGRTIPVSLRKRAEFMNRISG